MHIIKEGKIPKIIKKATCNYCKCVFEVEQGEYESSSQLEVFHDGLDNYKCKCPCCMRMVYFN